MKKKGERFVNITKKVLKKTIVHEDLQTGWIEPVGAVAGAVRTT